MCMNCFTVHDLKKLFEFCFAMIGRADIEGSKSNVAMNAWLPQASYHLMILTFFIFDNF